MQDAGLVGADGFNAQVQQFGNVGDRFADDQQAEDFELAVGKMLVRQLFHRRHRVHRQLFGHFDADVRPPRRHPADRADELRAGAFLGQVAASAGADGAHRILFFLVHGEDQDGQLGCFAANLPLC